jgi:hypothetical protein
MSKYHPNIRSLLLTAAMELGELKSSGQHNQSTGASTNNAGCSVSFRTESVKSCE